VQALDHYDRNEFDSALSVFDTIAGTSKILFNCGVIHATLGEHEKAVCHFLRLGEIDRLTTSRSIAISVLFSWTYTWQ